MIEVDRRTMLAGTAAAGLAVAGPAWAGRTGRRPALFVYDKRFGSALLAASEMVKRGVAVLDPRERDLGVAWREEIPAMIARGTPIAGITMWSDQFICESFAREHGLRLSSCNEIVAGDRRASGLREWVLA